MNPTKKYITVAIVIAVLGFMLSSIYIIYLMTRPPESDNNSEPDYNIDAFQDKIDQGVGAEGYEEREPYTNEQYEIDKKMFLKYFENERYEMASEHAQFLLAKYKFDDEKLYTISAIEEMNIMEKDKDEKFTCTAEERTNLYSKLHDIDMYIHFFIKSPLSEQAMMIYRDDVNMLPGFNWESITYERKYITSDDPEYKIIGNKEIYDVKLTFKKNCYFIKVLIEPSLQIVCITNEDCTMDGVKYQPAKDPYKEDIFK